MTLASVSTAPVAPLEQTAQSIVDLIRVLHANPGDDQNRQALAEARLSLARVIAGLSNQKRLGAECLLGQEIVLKLAESNLLDEAATPDALDFLAKLNTKQWPGLLAGMVVAPAWDWSNGPTLDDVPVWLWPTFTRYVFHIPQSFTAVLQAEKYAVHHLRRLVELDRWVSVNRGSAAVKVALETYVKQSNCIPLYFSESSLKKHYQLRARILSAAVQTPKQVELPAFSREGRRLRIGFINRHFGSQTETYTTLPTFEHLDPDRFEVCLFANQENGSALETYAKSRASSFTLLTGSTDDQAGTLLSANLDVAVFGTNVTAVTNETFLLGLRRVAPLQVVNNSSCTTTGLPEIDLYISGELTEHESAAEHFTERLALLPGPAHAFQYTVDAQEPSETFTRESVGVKDGQVLFVSGANFYKIIPEMMESWARILAAVPESKLLVHPFNPNWSSDYPIQRFCAEFDRVLRAHGAGEGRLIVSSAKFPSRADVKALLATGDLYLDTYPFGGVNSLVDPLESGVPCVVWEGATFRSRMGAALLRQLGLPELIAESEADYEALVIELATNPEKRALIKQRIETAMGECPLFLDTLASSEAFGGLIEKAFDELVVTGRTEFYRSRTILRAGPIDVGSASAEAAAALEAGSPEAAWEIIRKTLSAHPNHSGLRRLAGRTLSLLGKHERAAEFMLASIQSGQVQIDHWLELGQILYSAGKYSNAVEVVQICLQLAPRNLEALLLLGEVAEKGGILDQISDAVALAQEIAPHDLRVMTLATKVQMASTSS